MPWHPPPRERSSVASPRGRVPSSSPPSPCRPRPWHSIGRTSTPQWCLPVAALATIGLAWLVGLSTEQLAATSGAKTRALRNAAFGNIAELLLVLIAVSKGLTDVAITSVAGSVIRQRPLRARRCVHVRRTAPRRTVLLAQVGGSQRDAAGGRRAGHGHPHRLRSILRGRRRHRDAPLRGGGRHLPVALWRLPLVVHAFGGPAR